MLGCMPDALSAAPPTAISLPLLHSLGMRRVMSSRVRESDRC